MAKHLHDVLFNDLQNPPGLTPLLGIEQRGEMIAERMRAERALAGEALENITALVECLRDNLTDHAQGRLTTENLLHEVHSTVRTLEKQLLYREGAALTADIIEYAKAQSLQSR